MTISARIYATAFLSLLIIISCIQIVNAQSFVHPGLLHSLEDLDRMKNAVANKEEPIYSGYQVFIQNPASEHSYQMKGPMEMVGRNPTVGQTTYDSDANAAHQNAVMWAITGEKAYAERAIEIINAWSSTLKSITGRDAVLMAGLGPFKMVNAAEIIRYTKAGWSELDIKKTETHFKEIIYPVIKDFAPFANGNWDAAAIKTVMAIGVFCNDREIFERGLRYYVDGWGNGRLTHYILNEEGQIQESGRDQGHTQLGVGMLAECSEIAWHQGLNLYAYENNRLLKGFEYVAKFNLGHEVPFSPTSDRTGKYIHKQIARQDRGPLRAVYEQVYHHYVNSMGMSAPFTQQAAEKTRPEGPGRPGADHPGYGTLFYTRPVIKAKEKYVNAVPAAPGAIIAKGSDNEVVLTWVASIKAKTYTVKRGKKSGGPYSIIAKNISHPSYTDKTVKNSNLYYYTVTASNEKGESVNAFETGISAGLPLPWKHRDIGKVATHGSAFYDGKEYRLEGAGQNIDSVTDEFHFVYLPIKGDQEIIVRYVPQVSSQFSTMGLMLREGLTENAAHISLLLGAEHGTEKEAPGWNSRLIIRKQKGDVAMVQNISSNLTAPVVTHGRLTGEYWLRLQRRGNKVTGFVSVNGKDWTESGTVDTSFGNQLYMGIAVCSRIKNVSTTVRFDNVQVK